MKDVDQSQTAPYDRLADRAAIIRAALLRAESKIDDTKTHIANRRTDAEEELQRIRACFEVNAKTPGTYCKGRRPGDKMQVIAVSSFKGGSAKTSTTAHLADGLGLQGYRVLCIDTDPQGALTSLFGFAPSVRDNEMATLYDIVRPATARITAGLPFRMRP